LCDEASARLTALLHAWHTPSPFSQPEGQDA
jgi:hypothetical protein